MRSRVAAPTSAKASAPTAQRCSCNQHIQPGTCPYCQRRRARLSRKGAGQVALDESRRQQVLAVLRSPGRLLDDGVRADLEPWFQRDFSRVRIHDDASAAETARQLNASAYTVGRHIVFAPGRYEPYGPEGRRLLAHELTHVIQQERVPDGPVEDLYVGSSQDVLEQQADRTADLFSAGMAPPQGASLTPLGAPVIQRDACGPDVTQQIKNTWERVQADFRSWSSDDKKKACDYLLQPRIPKNPDDKSWFPDTKWNVDAFDTLPLFHKTGRGWLMHDQVVGAGCGVPTAPSKTDAKIYESDDYCSLSVQVKDQCWRSGTVNYGTYGVMCKLCQGFGVDYAGIYNWATVAMYAYKLRIFSEKATTAEEDISIPHSWFKATFEGGPGAAPSTSGNKSKKCPCTCKLTGSIVKWDYVWEPIKRRTTATKPGDPDLAASGVMPTPVPASPPGRS